MLAELYIKTGKIAISTAADACNAGIVTDASSPFVGYADTWVRYGLSLSDGAIDKLITPAPHKEPHGNSNVLTHGRAYLGASVGITDEREVSINVHIVARSKADFYVRWKRFCDEVLGHDVGDVILMKTKYFPETTYRLIYSGCEQIQTWRMEMALFSLIFKEPHPELQNSSLTNTNTTTTV